MQSIQEHLQRPYRRFVDLVRNRVNSINTKMHDPVFLDQYPGHSVPYVFSKIYEFGFVSPRPNPRFNGATSNPNFFESAVPTVNMADWILPRNGNILVNQEGPFYLNQVNISGYMNLTFNTFDGFFGPVPAPANPPVFPQGTGDIFSPVSYSTTDFAAFPAPTATVVSPTQSNGGAIRCNFFYDTVSNVYTNTPGETDQNDFRPCINFDVILFDKKRSRKLHDDVLSPHILCGQDFANKYLGKPMRFDPNTTIEPRIRITKCKPGNILSDGYGANVSSVDFRAYLCLLFKGYKVLERK